MDATLVNTLASLDLSEKQVKFLISSLKLGPSSIGKVSKAARIERSTAYLIAEELAIKGFLVQNQQGYRKKIQAIELKQILRMIAAKQRKLRRQEIALEEILPSLQAEYSNPQVKPRVRVYEGKEGLKSIWEDILSTKMEILLWTNQETEQQFFDKEEHEKFISQRTSKRIPLRVLAVNNPRGKALLGQDVSVLRETKLLPKETVFNSEIYIYDDKIAVLDYVTDIIGVIIESKPVTNSQRAIFELNWKNI